MREPIFWTSTTPGFNTTDRERVKFVDGKRVAERIPQAAHDGASSYENPTRLRNERAPVVLRHDGNETFLMLTCAAGHIDANTDAGGYQLAKARAFGWFKRGACPLLLVLSGELSIDQIAERSFVDKDGVNLAAKSCPPGSFNAENPCQHYVKERAARRKVHEDDQRSKQAGYVDNHDKLVDVVGKLAETVAASAMAKAAESK